MQIEEAYTISESAHQKRTLLPSPGNRNPVITLHGTWDSSEAMEAYNTAVSLQGYPVLSETYHSITNSGTVEESCRMLSRAINRARLQVARENLEMKVSSGHDPAAIRQFFKLDADLYGTRDESVLRFSALLPALLEEIERLVRLTEDELEENFSVKLSLLEQKLAVSMEEMGFAGTHQEERRKALCKKAAAALMDTIAPKAILIGHSMGGFVAYTVALNPRLPVENLGTGENSAKELLFGGGAGVAAIIALASPIGGGLADHTTGPAADYLFHLLEKICFSPPEHREPPQDTSLTPHSPAAFGSLKNAIRKISRLISSVGIVLIRPFIFFMMPGLSQIMAESNFVRRHHTGKRLPAGITTISVFTPEDSVCPVSTCQVDEAEEPTLFNLSVPVEVKPADLEPFFTTRYIQAHERITRFPYEQGAIFRTRLLEDARTATRMLDIRNYDGMRRYCLEALETGNPGKHVSEAVRSALREVAGERMPFSDAPSRLAYDLLCKNGETV